MITIEEALKELPGRAVYVLVPIGDGYTELEVIGVHECSIPRGQILLRVKGDKEFGR
jgi:hypothetical protein